MSRLSNKVAVITGGGSGIGFSAVELFLEEGAKVIAADINLEKTGQIATKYEGRFTGVEVDVSDSKSVKAMFDTVENKFGSLDILFNCAGIFPGDDGGVLDTPESTWDQVQNINLKGLWLCCKNGIPLMLRSGGGSIINVASFVSFVGAATAQVAYTASKGGVLALTREIAVEYARKNIRVNSICPGPIETPLLKELLSDEQRRQRRLVHIPMGRFGKSEEIAKAALFLASDDSSFVTGASLLVDGGITAAYVTPE
jgi:NAD(P)-dependent dehydrogenase (short-subunit alcohol dehydrogenase family)